VALSVNPAASEISFGRDSADLISHEMAGGAVRRPRADKAVFIFKNLTAKHAKYANIF